MKVTQEKLPASQIGLEIEITPEMSKQAYEKTLQDFMRSVNIPGFRKGKVPRQVLIQRLGATRIKATVIEELIDTSLKKALEQEKIEAIGSFELRSPFEELISQYEPGSPLTFSAAVDVAPTATLDQYQGFDIKAEEVIYTPQRVDEVLESYRNRMATLVPIEERAAQQSDVAVVDFVGRLAPSTEAAEGEAVIEGEAVAEATSTEIPGGSAADFEIELTEGKFIPGFIDGIIGMTSGETKEVAVNFPEDYPQADLAGKAAVFSITLKDLKEKELPELDDDFAQEISEFETLEALRTSLETRFQKEVEDKVKSNKEEAILAELVKHVHVDLPETLIKQEVNYMLTQTAMRLEEQGMNIKQMFTPEIVERLREQSRPEAITRIQRTMALGEVAKRESIKVTSAEVEAKVAEVLQDYAGQDVDRDRLRQVIEENLLKEKVFSWLEEHSTLELVPEGSLAPAEVTPAIDHLEEEIAKEGTEPASEATLEAEVVDLSGVPDVLDAIKSDAVEVSVPEVTLAETLEATVTTTEKATDDQIIEAGASTESSEAIAQILDEEKSSESIKKSSRSTKKSSKSKSADEEDLDPTSTQSTEDV